MAGFRKEYASSGTFSKEQIAQLSAYNTKAAEAYVKQDYATLVTALSSGVGLALSWVALAGIAATPVGVATAVITTIGAITAGVKNTVKIVCEGGASSLASILVDMVNESWTEVKTQFAVLEFVDENHRVIQPGVYVDQYKKNGVWYTKGKNY